MRTWLRQLALCLTVLSCLLPNAVRAHDARPVYVDIKETLPNHFVARWKVPVSVPAMALPRLRMPANCQSSGMAVNIRQADAYLTRQMYLCEHGLSEQTLALDFPSINPSLATLFRVQLANGEVHTHVLKPGALQWTLPAAESAWNISRQYTKLGIQHILQGIDHLLFVACLLFIAGTARRIIITITGFTLAHSLTLVLSTLRIVELPVPPVEAAIALSIVFLACEIVRGDHYSWTFRYPIAVSISFGLLHGFGFASVLRQAGLPQTELGTALLCFNAGVEIGQLLFIAFALALYFIGGRLLSLIAIRRKVSSLQYPLQTPASYVIGSIAAYWLVGRIAGFWI